MKNLITRILDWINSILSKINRDKIYHFFFGLVISIVCSWFFGWFGVLGSIMIGLGKEFIDKWTGGIFDWKDFLATSLGGILGILLLIPHLL